MEDPHRRSEVLTYLGLAFTSFTYAATPYFVRVAIQHSPSMSIVFLRFSIGTLCLMPLFMKQEVASRLPRAKDIALIAALGGLGIFIYHYLFFASLVYTEPVNVAVLAAMVPMFSSTIAALCGKENLPIRRICALALTFFGVLIVLSRGDISIFRTMDFNKGDLMMLVGVFFFSVYGVGCKGLLANYSAISVSFFGTVVTVLFALPFFLYEFAKTNWSEPSVWIAVVYMGFFPSGIGLFFQQIGIQRVGVGRAIGFINLVPVFSVIISLFVLGTDSVSLVQIASMSLILFGVFWNSKIR